MTGLNSLATKVDLLTRQLNQLSPQMQQPETFTTAVKSIANTISQAEKDQKLQNLFSMYNKGLQDKGIDPTHESFEDLGVLVSYSVDFIEDHTPSITELIDTVVEDTSQFKLQTCLKLIALVLPSIFALGEGLISSIINEVVRLKNQSTTAQLPLIDNRQQALSAMMVIKPKKQSLISTIRRVFH